MELLINWSWLIGIINIHNMVILKNWSWLIGIINIHNMVILKNWNFNVDLRIIVKSGVEP